MENNFDHIERFFSGAMNQEEIAEFEKRRSVDEELAKEILLYRQTNELVRASARKRMKQHLDDMGNKEFANTMIETYMRYHLVKKYWFAIAASILVVIGLSYFAYHSIHAKNSSPALAELFDAYYEVPAVVLVTSRGDHTEDALAPVWNSALQKYSENRFEDASEDFRLLLQNSAFSHTSAANFYLGICYLSMNLPDSAVSCFNYVSPASALSQDATWYIGLSYLKAGNLPGATEVFDNITKLQKHYKKDHAEEILLIISKSTQK